MVDEAHRVLAALHPVEIWNLPDEVLLKAVERLDMARSPADLAAWLHARLSERKPLPRELRSVSPVWPRGVAFPLAGEHGGKIGFVSASPYASFPKRTSASTRAAIADKLREKDKGAPIEAAARKIVDYFNRDLKLNLPTSVWTPDLADGDSIGLATLAATLTALLEETAGLPALRYPAAFSGVVNLERGELSPVDGATLPDKIAAAADSGFKWLFVVEGQEGVKSSSSIRVRFVPRNLRNALAMLMSVFQASNPRIFQHFNKVQLIARNLNFPISSADRFLPGVLAALVSDPDELPLLRREMGLGNDSAVFGVDAWTRFIKQYAPDGPNRGERLVQLCHVMLEHHANDQQRMPLVHLTVHLNRSQLDALTCQTALKEIDKAYNGVQEAVYANHLQLQTIAGAVQRSHQFDFLSELISRKDEVLTTLAILSATRLYDLPPDDINRLRDLLGTTMNSRALPSDSPLRQRVVAECRTDFRSFFGSASLGEFGAQIRAREAEMCKYPVTNLDFECFDPTHARCRYSSEDESPVVNVTWYAAYNFAFWAKLRLPTRLEWLSAAVPPGWASPYQYDDFRLAKPNYDSAGTQPVRRQATTPSHTGCVDMSGNVWEWVMDWCPARSAQSELDDTRRALQCRMTMGGGWQSNVPDLNLTTFAPLAPGSRSVDVGFRCIRLGK
ncbi:MAG: SUMF1/EgtB/PvdO family nonheme iron enzyme [Pirellulaceae bacterium]|nr:SUMF1/EgtB/PvdO family nonheme iron enzyme [Pirellulaceae bacterium]